MTRAATNCAVSAISAITGEAPETIVAGIAACPAYDGGPAFVGDAVKVWSVARYLVDLRGWELLLRSDRPSLPWTGVVGMENHFFAIVRGRVHDPAACSYNGAEIALVFVPPDAAARAAQTKAKR